MKIGVLLGYDQECNPSINMFGLSITWWRREEWQVGIRFTILFGRNQYGVRFSTYSWPMFSGNFVPKNVTWCPPKAPASFQ